MATYDGSNQFQYTAFPSQFQGYAYPTYPPPSTSPTPPTQPNFYSTELMAAQDRASRRRIVGVTCLLSTLIIVALIALDAVFLSYICVMHQCKMVRLSLVSTAPLGHVLGISQVTSHVAPISVPIVMGLFSYLLAAKWLSSSQTEGQNRPSPMQLGLLLTLCSGANFSALFSSIKYVFGIGQPSGNGKAPRHPPILHQSILFLGSLLTVTYIAAGADAWLHNTSKSISIVSISSYSSVATANFGREINSTLCDPSQYVNGSVGQLTCGLISGGSGGSGRTLAEGVRVVSNSSSLHKVVYADDQTAIIIPNTLPDNITYTAQTIGVKSQCRSITRQCVYGIQEGQLVDYGPDAAANINCTRSGIAFNSTAAERSLCALDSQGNCIFGYDVTSNTGEIIVSNAYLDAAEDTWWFVHGNNGAWNVVYCNVTTLQVNYTYASSRFRLRSSTPTSVFAAQRIMGGGLRSSSGDTVISDAVDGAGLQTNTTYEQAYALELSRQMLARGAYIYQPANVELIANEKVVNGSNLQVIPLVLFNAALLVFACQIIYISVRIILAARGIQYVRLAALYLSNPLATVQTLYGHPDPLNSWETDSTKRSGPETEADRLRIGPVPLSTNGQPGSAFAVTKG
ncbi:hypothetical protein CVT26_010796 [Gymnopilus dilepis]|uniref:Transmembrane protein n=1 Tax=Gymnopilus dilepis TaxID=231916 RepID=A0A409VIF7_9AGAR|nr:hypothetical protein CVT26_010796 [Gymnopilus dilepis]